MICSRRAIEVSNSRLLRCGLLRPDRASTSALRDSPLVLRRTFNETFSTSAVFSPSTHPFSGRRIPCRRSATSERDRPRHLLNYWILFRCILSARPWYVVSVAGRWFVCRTAFRSRRHTWTQDDVRIGLGLHRVFLL
jgi:hypothetical protein